MLSHAAICLYEKLNPTKLCEVRCTAIHLARNCRAAEPSEVAYRLLPPPILLLLLLLFGVLEPVGTSTTKTTLFLLLLLLLPFYSSLGDLRLSD